MSETGQPHVTPVKPVRLVVVWLIIESILALPGLAIGGMMALTSPFLFSAPGSDSNPAVYVLALSAIAFPVVLLVSLTLAWIAVARVRDRGAVILSLLPGVPVIVGIGAMTWLNVTQ